MTKDDVLAYFEGRVTDVAAAFEPPMLPWAIYQWKEVPPLRQMQLEIMTQGELKAVTGIIPRYTIRKIKTDSGYIFKRVYRNESKSKS